MKSSIREVSCLVLLSCVLTLLYYVVVGEPNRAVVCVKEDLEPHHVCLSTVVEEWAGDIQWVDARPRADWKKNGMTGSVLLSDDPKEDFNEMLAQSMEAIFMASQLDKKVVIYCNGVACGSSKAVYAKLMEQGIYDQIYILHGGWKALSQEVAKESSVLRD